MSYKDLYLKYKTKYLNLKYDLVGGASGVDAFIKDCISTKDKELAQKAKTNLDNNNIAMKAITNLDNNNIAKLPISTIDKGILKNKGYNIEKVYPFMYSFLVEYGFNKREGQINYWIQNNVSLYHVINLLKLLQGSKELTKKGNEGKEGILERGHRAIYAAIIANMFIGVNGTDHFLNLSKMMFNLNLMHFSHYNIIIPEIEIHKNTFEDYDPKTEGSLIPHMAKFFYYLYNDMSDFIDKEVELTELLRENKTTPPADIKLTFLLNIFKELKNYKPNMIVSCN